jgi:hypothetical protein
VAEHYGFIGTATNNVAEYQALVHAFRLASARGARRIEIRSDSELVVKQMNGVYKVKHPDMITLWRQASTQRRAFEGAEIKHVRREQRRQHPLRRQVRRRRRPSGRSPGTPSSAPRWATGAGSSTASPSPSAAPPRSPRSTCSRPASAWRCTSTPSTSPPGASPRRPPWPCSRASRCSPARPRHRLARGPRGRTLPRQRRAARRALSLSVGAPGDLLDHLGPQDVFAFTGSGKTGALLRGATQPPGERDARQRRGRQPQRRGAGPRRRARRRHLDPHGLRPGARHHPEGRAEVHRHPPGAGPGTVLPSLVHGGPGRAGNGEELGGERGLAFYMQRTAIEGSRPVIERILKSQGAS